MKFKNNPLSVQLSIIFTVFILSFALFTTFALSKTLEKSLKNDLFDFIDHTEEETLNSTSVNIFTVLYSRYNSANSKNYSDINVERLLERKTLLLKDSIAKLLNRTTRISTLNPKQKNRFNGVNHHYLFKNNTFIDNFLQNNEIPDEELEDFFNHMKTQFDSQEEPSKKYSYDFGSGNNKYTLYYKISKINDQLKNQVLDIASEKLTAKEFSDFNKLIQRVMPNISNEVMGLITYSWDSTATSLIHDMLKNIIPLLLVGTLLAILLGIVISRHLSKPLRALQSAVKKIGKRKWDTPLSTDRKDEIGELTLSLENMRKQLISAHEQEQWMLQKISHELKTPVMIIRSYAQAAKDSIYPKGTLIDSLDTIDTEAVRLDKRIKELLYLTKLNYLSKHNVEKVKIDLQELISDVVDSFEAKRGNITINTDLEQSFIEGVPEQLKVVIENLVDNSLRYAVNELRITLKRERSRIHIKVFNDGESISDKVLENIFEPFFKGSKGNYGLGLAIAKNIVSIHNGTISVQNVENGVLFLIGLDALKER